ncbi:hypothetical protein [Nostoc parmelioides]|uniref:Uncharacterized protein n=1 Tax=Nostoc parmelioides FACHB-3921 TaxID=2692909 RepID=A0ABR8B899_9NOSO|nr:hypothetical protein [Nostoc parmelioides]MBD2249734.1 hypothetical protein [Nostoc parmelioides FACHB-3921]
MRDRVSLETVSLSLPFGIGSMSWKVNTTEQKAAWSLYVSAKKGHLPMRFWSCYVVSGQEGSRGNHDEYAGGAIWRSQYGYQASSQERVAISYLFSDL